MADTLITNLSTGDPAQSSDELVANRGGSDVKLTAGSIAALATPAGSDTQIQYNNAGAFGASSSLVWVEADGMLQIGPGTSGGNTCSIMAASGNSLFLAAGDDQSVAAQGGSATVTDGTGGTCDFSGGDGNGSGDGGGVFFEGGTAPDAGTGGIIELVGGESTNGIGGDVYLEAGSGGSANGNIILAGLPTSDPSVAGAVYIDGTTLKISAG